MPVSARETTSMSITTLERPAKRSSGKSPVAATAIPLRRVFRVEVMGRDGANEVWFVPMERGGNARSHRCANYPRQAMAGATTRTRENVPAARP